MIRKILGIVAGIAAAFVIILLVENFDEWLYPVPVDLDASDAAALTAYVFTMPLPAKLLVVFGWFLGSFGGALVHYSVDIAKRPCDGRFRNGFRYPVRLKQE